MSLTTPRPAPLRRIPALDGVRGVAILMVVAYHYVAIPIHQSPSPLLQWLRHLLSRGGTGVDLFFVLSGFLIGRILLHHREAPNYYRVFYLRRIARIFPAYYELLLLFLGLRWLAHHAPFLNLDPTLFANPLPLEAYLIYGQNLAMILHGTFGNEFLAITWSLAIEEQFYLFLPWLVRVTSPRRFPWVALGFLGLPLLLRRTLGGDGKFYGLMFTPWRFDALFFGVLLAVLESRARLSARWKKVLPWVFLLLTGRYFYLSFSEPLGSTNHLFFNALLYATLLAWILSEEQGRLARLLQKAWLRKIGMISYGIYLFHQLVNGLLHAWIFHQPPRFQDLPSIGVTLLAAGVTYGIAWVNYHLLEKRFINWGHRWRYVPPARNPDVERVPLA
ncbi:MAG TPA: acyltransferase [Anaerolineales bacterium]|nr:acyltransferase [Anaerolineales bacterium]